MLTLKEERVHVDLGAMSSLTNRLYEMPTRINYNIETAKEEYQKFNINFSRIINETEKMNLSEERARVIKNRLENEFSKKINS